MKMEIWHSIFFIFWNISLDIYHMTYEIYTNN